MTQRKLGIVASVLILMALALIVVGLSDEQPILWGFGLVAAGAAMLMSLLTRWARSEAE